jgi:shikimate dehydrogenase
MIRAAVLGKPIAHSLSPEVHGEIYKRLGLEFDYRRMEMNESEAIKFFKDLIENGTFLDWNGFSLTMPLKQVAFALDLKIDNRGMLTQSVNTLTPAGAFNTDVTGFIRVLDQFDLSAPVIIGNGATARSALLALKEKKQGLPTNTLVIRRNRHGDDLLLHIDPSISVVAFDDLQEEVLSLGSIAISTILSSAQATLVKVFESRKFPLLDCSYSPWPTPFAEISPESSFSGLGLLVAQAIDQALLFSGQDFDRDEMFRSIYLSTEKKFFQ